ncbi:MAG: ABC transporter ATP-binding protein [Desulforegulaceae bacterium]|nr:ABC transporter ATP-binding protein [Desulforegulaceae bacterium]
MEDVIEVSNLIHSYGKKKVLDKLSFSVKKGRIFGLLGKNGAGKTTTINIMMGFLQPQGGTCRIFGEPSYDISPETRKRIGLLHETHLQYYFMNIKQAQKFYSAFYPKWDFSIFKSLMDKLGLDEKHKISKMSCGQRSQVTLALILAQRPDLMILDDYSLGLDAGYRRLFLEYLVDYAKENQTTILITSHIVQDLEKFVDDIVILDKGKTMISSTLEDFSRSFSRYIVKNGANFCQVEKDEIIRGVESYRDDLFIYSFKDKESVKSRMIDLGFVKNEIIPDKMTLEDAFIGLTGKY